MGQAVELLMRGVQQPVLSCQGRWPTEGRFLHVLQGGCRQLWGCLQKQSENLCWECTSAVAPEDGSDLQADESQ